MQNPEEDQLTVHIEQSRLDILLAEYNNLYQQIDSSTTQLASLLTILITAVTAILTTGITQKVENIYLLILIPVAVMIIGGFVIHLFTRWSTFFFQARLVSSKIVKITKQPPTDLYFNRESAASRFQSLRRNSNYQTMIYLIFSLAFILIAILFVSFFIYFYEVNHLLGFLYGLGCCVFAVISLCAIYSILVELPKRYDRVLNETEYVDKTQITPELKRVKSNSFILPRPADFITKSWLFFFGVITSGILIGFKYFNPTIYSLFTNKPVGSELPLWMVFAFAACWYLTQEFLVQQAKYAWNDIRDKQRDLKTGGKEDRFLVGQDYDARLMALLTTFRFLLGIGIGYLLDTNLGILLTIITIIHIFYELYVKTHAGNRFGAGLAVVVIAVGSPLRFLSGVLSVNDHIDFSILILCSTFLFYGIAYIAKYWKIEAEHVRAVHGDYPPRPQSDYFVKNGDTWQNFGFIGMMISFVMLWVNQSFHLRLEQHFISWINTALGLFPSVFLSQLLLFVTITLLTVLFTLPIYKLLSRFLLRLSTNRTHLIISISITIAILIGLSIVFPVLRNPFYYLCNLLILVTIGSLITYNNMGYEQYLMIYARKNSKYIGPLIFEYLFEAQTGLTIKKLSQLINYLMNHKIADFSKLYAHFISEGKPLSDFNEDSKLHPARY